MFEHCPSSSISSLKRQCASSESEFTSKKPKLDEFNADVNVKTETFNAESNREVAQKLVSLILTEQKRNVQIYPSQIVWCREEKSPFWPAMVWSSKTGKITDDKLRVLVKFFAKSNRNVWMKMFNIFPFDGLASFEKMRNSVNMQLMTTSMKRDFDFAFNTANELWSRGVAQAIYCMAKNRDERLALFTALSSSSKLQKSRNPLRRRSFELDVPNSCSVKEFRVNDEVHLVESFIKDISFPTAEPSTNAVEFRIESYEKKFLEFVTESLNIREFHTGIDGTCNVCLTINPTDQLVKCAGNCDGYLHPDCPGNRAPTRLIRRDNEGESTNYFCEDCSNNGSKEFCFICKAHKRSSQSGMVKCKISHCSRLYHPKCLENWSQAKWNVYDGNLNLICPLHECHQCGDNAVDNGAKLTTCIKCPTALHMDSNCIQAGTVILSNSHHICLKHRPQRKKISNLDYCYICRAGFNLLRCKACPHSFHEMCSSTASPTICAKCLSGQHPVYGDIVWAKLYTYAWWPAIIVPSHCIPPNIRTDNHSPHDICVCFFGDHTFAWIDTRSVYPLDEDNFVVFTETTNKFGAAILSARKWLTQAKCIKLKKQTGFAISTSADILQTEALPPYENILENIPIAPAAPFLDANNEASSCRCDANDDDPCGVTSNCLNRASCTECNDLCSSGDKCRNKCIQQADYPKVYLEYFGNKGHGLVSDKSIPCGSIVQQYTGEVINAFEYERRARDERRTNVYFMRYTRDLFIDAETKGSLARFINHSCNPNCRFHLWSVNGVNVVVVVALEDIPKDTEITCKYDWSRNIPCLCNENNCSGFC